ncbi:50S ribosomal protein L2 [Candidatus Woesearchaeota archaeon]|nr:50S ribosomal protein L2 [Candidatus Woesearchaeota archaeon]
MGKNLIQQARGKGGPRYRAPSFRYKGSAVHKNISDSIVDGRIIDLVKCQGHSAPLAKVKYDTGEQILMLAPEGIRVGDSVSCGQGAKVKAGNTMILGEIPEGTLIYNIESNPGDGGKFCRASGTFARVLTKIGGEVVVELPSKKQKTFQSGCRANIGIIAGGGRKEKPFLKAGRKYYAMKAKNKLWPIVCGQSMNAVDHPHGGSKSSKKNYPYTVSRNASPGAKVGAIAARRTGRKKR